MAHHALSSQESYNPNHLLDILLGKMQLKNDAALSRMLEVAPPVISKIRHHRLPVGASLLIRMHEVTGMSIRDLRDLMGDRRTKYRLSDAQGRPKPEKKLRKRLHSRQLRPATHRPNPAIMRTDARA
jgi:plasmid maintenance system antidote protein VapI